MDCAAGSTKAISAEELREYLHLPAKEVAKSLGMCLTSLKKVCRQHGIKRWPYRRLKSIDKKIQSLESTMGQGASDGDDLKRQIDQLHNEKASLPTNYGTASSSGHASSGRGSPDGEFDGSMPSSPLSCASTTVLDPLAPHDDAGSSRATTPGAHASAFHSVPPSPAVPPQAAPTAAAALAGSAPSTPRASLPGPARASAKQPARPKAARGSTPAHKGAAAAEGGALKLEVQLPPHVAEMMARGARMRVEQVGERTELRVDERAGGAQVVIDLALLASDAVREHLRQREEGRASPPPRELSDDEMISALVGCAGERGDAEAAEPRELSDSEIALALAGCVGQGGGGADEEEAAAFPAHNAEDIFSVAAGADDAPMPDDTWFVDEHAHAGTDYEMAEILYPGMDSE